MSDEIEQANLVDAKQFYRRFPNATVTVPIYVLLFVQFLNFIMFCYIIAQIVPIKNQIEPLVNKSTEIVNRINVAPFTVAVNKASVVVGNINQLQFLHSIDKAMEIMAATNTTQFNSALDKTSNVINGINQTLFQETIDDIQNSIVPSLDRLLPIIENNVTTTFYRLEPVVDQIPSFINETEAFIAQIKRFFNKPNAEFVSAIKKN